TADAVRRNLAYVAEADYDLVLILSGDQLYRMDFQEMIRNHVETKAEATIATIPVAESEAISCGIMKLDEAGRGADFVEQPSTAEALQQVRTNPDWLDRHGIWSGGREYLASMGIYLFNVKTLVEILAGSATDFGREIFPDSIPTHRLFIYPFDGYW